MNIFFDNRFNEKRRTLIESLRRKGINDEKVLEVMSQIPREIFVHHSFINRSYEDTALPIDCNQTISQPYTVAYMTALLNVKPNSKILEIGTGSGYQACILKMLGARVYTIERIPELYENTKDLFNKLNLSIFTKLGDGTLGWLQFAPYDGIIITAGAPVVPASLQSQLAISGVMIIPIGDRESQDMCIIKRIDKDTFEEKKIDKFKFVPLIGKEGWTETK